MGKAVIASGHGGQAELVEHGRTGLLVTPGDAEALAAAMQSLVSDQHLRNSLARSALSKAEAFKAKSIVPRIEAIYRDVHAARASSTKSIAAMRESPERQHGL